MYIGKHGVELLIARPCHAALGVSDLESSAMVQRDRDKRLGDWLYPWLESDFHLRNQAQHNLTKHVRSRSAAAAPDSPGTKNFLKIFIGIVLMN